MVKFWITINVRDIVAMLKKKKHQIYLVKVPALYAVKQISYGKKLRRT